LLDSFPPPSSSFPHFQNNAIILQFYFHLQKKSKKMASKLLLRHLTTKTAKQVSCSPIFMAPLQHGQLRKGSTFHWEDALDLESLLTEEERQVRDTARAYCQEKLLPR